MNKMIAFLTTHDAIRNAAGADYKETWWGNQAIAKKTANRVYNSSPGDLAEGVIYFNFTPFTIAEDNDESEASKHYHYTVMGWNGLTYYGKTLADLPDTVLRSMEGSDAPLLIAIDIATGFPMFQVRR